jgi:ribosomal protein S18 acetylase RimI-like enzyme
VATWPAPRVGTTQPLQKAAAALAASLIDDPFYQAITTDREDDVDARLSVLAQYFDYSLQEASRVGRCLIHDDPALGAAAWLLPRTVDVELAETAAKAAYLAELLGPRGWDNYSRIIGFMSDRSKPLVPAGAWYLTIIAVHPSAQGRGIGAQLLQPTLAEATRAGAHAFLETFTSRTLAFYERAGFVRVAQFVEPTTKAPYALMQRAP